MTLFKHPLIAALSDTAVEVRFWAVWSLGGQTIRESNSPIVPALEKLLADDSVYEGWWSIRREALAVLGSLNPTATRYRQTLNEELERVGDDPDASVEDRRWGDAYGWRL